MQPYTIDKFGGLNLLDDPEEVGAQAAVDLLNVDLMHPGILRSRGGYTVPATAAATAGNLHSHERAYPNLGQILVGLQSSPVSVAAYTPAGSLIASHSVGVGTVGVSGYAQMRSGTTNVSFIAFPTNTLRTWDGAAFAAPTATVDGVGGLAMPKAVHIGVTPWDFRLVAGFDQAGTNGPNGAAQNESTLYFSAPGNGTTWAAADNISLTPGDGESISAIVPWREYLFVFKKSKFFVFYGTATQTGTGGPIFNYRTVDTGIGCEYIGNNPHTIGVTAAKDAVYFAGDRGIYKTMGGEPQLISGPITPLFDPVLEPTRGIAASGTMTVYCHLDRILVSANAGLGAPYDADEYTLVYDITTGQWFVWDRVMYSMVTVPPGTLANPTLWFTDRFSSAQLRKYATDVTTDNGTAIPWRYTSGLYDMESPETKRIRESLLWGTGTPTFQMAVNHGAVDTGGSVTLGTSPAVAEGRQRIARRGRFFQHKLSGTTPATINRLVHHIAEQRQAGTT